MFCHAPLLVPLASPARCSPLLQCLCMMCDGLRPPTRGFRHYFVWVQRRRGHMVGFRKRSVTFSFKQTWFPVSWMKVVCVCVTFTQAWPPPLLALSGSGKNVIPHHPLGLSESECTFLAGGSILKEITPDKVVFYCLHVISKVDIRPEAHEIQALCFSWQIFWSPTVDDMIILWI